MARGLATELYTPTVTTGLKQMIVSFNFIGHGPDDLASGCQPFLVSYAGSAYHYRALEAASVGNQLSQGEQSASLSDYRTLKDKEKVRFPRDIAETGITLVRFAVLCQVLFQGTGPAHPLVQELWSTAFNLQNMGPFITEGYQKYARTPSIASTYYPRVLRTVQVEINDYFHQVAVNPDEGLTGVDVPKLSGLLLDLKRGVFPQSTNWLSIPDEYLSGNVTPSVASTVTTRGVTTSGGSVASKSDTAISTLTGDTRESVHRVNNPAPDNEFATLSLRSGGVRPIVRSHPPPRNDAGNEFCVSWWTRGGCYPNCARRETHRSFASPAERERLMAYVREHMLAAAGAPASA